VKKKIFLFFTVVTTFIYTNPVFAATSGDEKIDVVGNRILGITRSIGYWIILTSALYCVIGCVKEHDIKKLFKLIGFHVIVYASLYFVPWLMRQVEGVW
jgi:hypothetical protein